MSLNSEIKFSEIPSVNKPRSTFDRSFKHQTSVNSSDLVPIMWDEVLPGDTFQIDFSHVTRMTTPIAPVADNCVMDVFAFFVPTRLLWTHWPNFWGQNDEDHWTNTTQYNTPKLSFYNTDQSAYQEVQPMSLLNYLGLPAKYKPSTTPSIGQWPICALPLRGYVKCWNDWFRDENLQDPIVEYTGDSATDVLQISGNTYSETDYVTDVAAGAYCAKANKLHDYFTSALPGPLKGQEISLFGPNVQQGMLPVITASPNVYTYTGSRPSEYLKWVKKEDGSYLTISTGKMAPINIAPNTDGSNSTLASSEETLSFNKAVVPANLWASLGQTAVNTISELRTAFAIQRYYEACARGGTRYTEWLQNIFSVTSPDGRLQRSEFLGSRRFPINMDQVLQTSATNSVSPQGNTAAFSCTVNSDDLCTYSATEHGYVYVLLTIRQEHSYAQGINKQWTRDTWEDYYIPQFAHLSEMPILNREIYAQAEDGYEDQVFGYQEAWAEYRYKPNMVTGKMSPQVTGSLSIWNYADYYTSRPNLSDEWIHETPTNIQRTLAVQNEPQFIVDAYLSMKWTRIMPLYSVPGLMDHF